VEGGGGVGCGGGGTQTQFVCEIVRFLVLQRVTHVVTNGLLQDLH